MRLRANILVAAAALGVVQVPGAMSQVQWDAVLQPPPSFENFGQCLEALSVEDPTQELILTSTYERSMRAFAARVAAVQRSLDEVESRRTAFLAARPDGHDPWIESGEDFGALELLLSWERDRRDLEQEFVRSLVPHLQEDQVAVWDHTIRTLRRERVLAELNPFSAFSSVVDLSALLGSIDLSERERRDVASVMDQYESQLDASLRRYEANIGLLLPKILLCHKRIRQGQPHARVELTGYVGEVKDMIKSVQSVNELHIHQFASHLSDKHRNELLSKLDRANFPGLFARSRVDAAIDVLRGSGLSDAQRQAMEAIYESYVLERSARYRRLLAANRKWNGPRELELREARRAELIGAGEDAMAALVGHPGVRYLRQLYRLEQSTCRTLAGLCAEATAEIVEVRLLLDW